MSVEEVVLFHLFIPGWLYIPLNKGCFVDLCSVHKAKWLKYLGFNNFLCSGLRFFILVVFCIVSTVLYDNYVLLRFL